MKSFPMKRLLVTFLYVALASGAITLSSASALAQARATKRSVEDDRRALLALEDEWLAHVRDSTTLERILAPDFIHVVESGAFLTKAQHIAWCVANPLPATRRAYYEKHQVHLFGDMGIVSGIVSSSDGGRRATRTVFTDVFAYRDKRWQAVHAQETRMVTAPATPASTHQE